MFELCNVNINVAETLQLSKRKVLHQSNHYWLEKKLACVCL